MDIKYFLQNIRKEANQGFFDLIDENTGYLWREMLANKGTPLKVNEISKGKVHFEPTDLGLAEYQDLDKKRIKSLEKEGEMLVRYHEAVDELCRLALTDDREEFKFSRLIRSILSYDLAPEDFALLKRMMLKNPAEIVISRTDVLSNGLVTELQIASGGWSLMQRVAEQNDSLGKDILENFYKAIQEHHNLRDNYRICFVVHEQLSSYWSQFADFADILNTQKNKDVAYVSGPEGLVNKEDGLYLEANNSDLIKIDMVYSLGDVRRFFDRNGRQILEAYDQKKVYFEPTINPLLNNSQLSLALLNNPLTREWLVLKLGLKFIDRLSKEIVNYYIIGDNLNVSLNLQQKTVHVPAKSLNNFLYSSLKDELLLRSVLTEDLNKLSGGWGLVKTSKLKSEDLKNMISESILQYDSMLENGKVLKGFNLICFSRYYKSIMRKTVRIAKYFKKEDEVNIVNVVKPRISDSAFYLKIRGKQKLVGYYRQYADQQDTGIKIGGKMRSIGGFIKN